MKKRQALTIRILKEAHRDLKIMSALSGRPMGDLIEDMIFLYRKELAGGKDWGDDARDLIAERERESKQKESAFERRKEKAEHRRKVMDVIGKLRDEEGLTFDEIASRLVEDGYQTLTGKGNWQGGSVYKLYKKKKESSLPTLLDLILSHGRYGSSDNETDE